MSGKYQQSICGAWQPAWQSELAEWWLPARPLACRSLLALRNEPCPASISRASVGPDSLSGSQSWLHGGAWRSCRPFEVARAHSLAGSQSAPLDI